MQGATGLQFYYLIADPKVANIFEQNSLNAIVFKLQSKLLMFLTHRSIILTPGL